MEVVPQVAARLAGSVYGAARKGIYRIKQDKRRTGVLVSGASRSNMFQLIINLIYEEAISEEDLKEFSEDLRDTVKTRLKIDLRYCEN